MRQNTRTHHWRGRRQDWRPFFKDSANYMRCADCPNNEHYGAWEGRLPCGAWHCFVVKPTEDTDRKTTT